MKDAPWDANIVEMSRVVALCELKTKHFFI